MQQSLFNAYSNPMSEIVREDGQSITRGMLGDAADIIIDALAGLPQASRIGIATSNPANTLAAFEAIRRVGGMPALLPLGSNADKEEQCQRLELSAYIEGDAGLLKPVVKVINASKSRPEILKKDSVILFTSGTSSAPKPVVHNWRSLASAVHFGSKYACRSWLLAYHVRSFAGLQIMLQALLTGGTIVSNAQISRTYQALTCRGIDFASATPSYWRALLLEADWRPVADGPTQITLGGEVADQHLLDQLRAKFPQARMSHIYASTELGVCFSVHDGKAGFPISWLDESPSECKLRIADDGELLIQSHRRMKQYLDEQTAELEWFPTGDVVHVCGDRVLFRGRKTDIMNIGGFKAIPQDIENIIRVLPGIVDVCVFGIDSSITGQVAAANVQIESGCDGTEIRGDIMAACRAALPKQMVPARVTVTTETIRQGDKVSRVGT